MIVTLIVDVDMPITDQSQAPQYVANNLEGRWVTLDCYVPSPEELEDRATDA